jgi:predicted transcriptional regulator
MDNILKTALNDFSYHLALAEIQIFKERKSWRATDAMAAYFQSTPEKAAFSRLMYIAACVNQGYTVSQISAELQISRQTICKFTDECCAAGWIVWEKVRGNSYIYMASDELCASIVEYADYSSDVFLNAEVHNAELLLALLKRRNSDLPSQVTNIDYAHFRGGKDEPQKKAS